MKFAHICLKARIVFLGHVLNPLWRSREHRRSVRGAVIAASVSRYLDRYAHIFSQVPEDTRQEESPGRIFSIWFQGKQSAPAIVQACWRSIRANCSEPLVILDAGNILDWVSLPEVVVDKWKRGLIRPAHFADICRVDLLYRYGGVWMDATDFVTAPLPSWVMESDFFMYRSGSKLKGSYAFVQNCFIRSAKSDYLIKCWREAILAYWTSEDRAVDYFIHQMLFRKVIEVNPLAAEHFRTVPSLDQDPTHELWFRNALKVFDPVVFKDITSRSVFQKTEYKSRRADSPAPGTYAAVMLNMYPES